ncbi:MAG: arginine--tRNA ligase [Candidatus Thermoplasmatota archaeon]|nr:arginine--tRNA ligase [Candidatus Thermoplasmatota archaeon]
MLLFQDILELTKSEARKHIENLDEKDVIFDQTEHAHITVRLVRYEKTVDNFDTKLNAIMNELKKLPFVQSLEYENGYINIITDGWYLLNAMHESLQTTGSFPESFQDPERVSVEHTSTNPTGPIHMGRIRNSIIGDSIARLMERYGYRVVTQYYVNDSGKQMVSLYLGYEKFHKGETLTKEILLDGYKKIYEYFEQKGDEKEVELLMEKYEKGDDDLINQIKNIAQIMLDDIVSDLELLNIKMDEFTWESEFIVTGETEEVIKDLSEYILEENGALYIDVPNVRKIFVKRKNGTSLYVTRDIAYHMYKFSQYDKCIVVVGEDHKEHGKIMDYVMHQLLDYKNSLDFVYYGMVNLESGRMSTRKGTSVTVKEVYEKLYEKARNEVLSRYSEEKDVDKISRDIAVSSLRFYMLKINMQKPITFKWEDALDFNGETAPFIMYSYTRASSIMEKVKSSSGGASSKNIEKEENDLILEMYKYPYKIMNATKSLRPDIITGYILDLSKKFTTFYEKCKVLGEETGIQERRLNILKTYMNIIDDSSQIVGIKNVKKM